MLTQMGYHSSASSLLKSGRGLKIQNTYPKAIQHSHRNSVCSDQHGALHSSFVLRPPRGIPLVSDAQRKRGEALSGKLQGELLLENTPCLNHRPILHLESLPGNLCHSFSCDIQCKTFSVSNCLSNSTQNTLKALGVFHQSLPPLSMRPVPQRYQSQVGGVP